VAEADLVEAGAKLAALHAHQMERAAKVVPFPGLDGSRQVKAK